MINKSIARQNALHYYLQDIREYSDKIIREVSNVIEQESCRGKIRIEYAISEDKFNSVFTPNSLEHYLELQNFKVRHELYYDSDENDETHIYIIYIV